MVWGPQYLVVRGKSTDMVKGRLCFCMGYCISRMARNDADG